ncbi:MAG TPA: DMT family transporter, partial [Candidatus Acidoferrum sp.]|nr:DMT family transporter [Candidatus Acidoferrum sp.]
HDTIKTDFPLLPILAGMGATFLYGLTGNYSRKFLHGVTSLTVTAGCQTFSALCLLPFALLQWPASPVPASIWVWIGVLGIICTGTGYMIYFHLLATVGVARTVIVTYLSPVFAVLWGLLFLGEGVTLKMLAGALGIMAGIALTTYRPKGYP